MMQNMIRETLFAVLRSGMGIDTPPPDLSADVCAELMRIGTRQSILPLLLRGLKRLGAPQDVVREFDKACLKDVYRVIQQNEALARVGSALDQAKIPYVFLKGAVLRDLYPAEDLRTSSDIDVLVREETLTDAIAAIEAGTDFKTVRRAYHDVSLFNARVHLELHFNIKENEEKLDKLLSRAWDYAVPAEGSRCDFTPEYQVFYVTSHMCHHFLHGGLGIRPFLDLWLLRTKTRFDEAEVRRMCAVCGILKFYEESAHLSAVWMENAQHDQVTLMLENFCFSGGVFGSDQFKNAGRQRKKRGWNYIFSRIFPPASQVREFYQDRSGKKHTTAYYYFKRLISWFGKRRRDELKRQVSDILADDRKYQDSADELFRFLDL